MPGGLRGVARRLAPVTAAAVCLSLAAPAAQQQRASSQTQPTFRAGVELVQIDVVVVDRQGRHVRGLKAGDFALTDRKKPQTIAAFEEVTHERPRAADDRVADVAPARMDVADNQSVQAHRLVVMVIDDLHIWRGRTDLTKTIAKDVLAKLGGDASMAVLFTSGEHSTEVTEDRAALMGAVETLRGRKGVRRPTAAIDKQGMAAGGGEGGRSLGEIAAAQSASVQDFFDNMSKYKALEDAARLLGQGDARRKAFVLISEGIAKDLTGVFDAATTPCDALCAKCPCHHERAARMMMNSLRRSNVVTYAIDPRGHITTQNLALELFPGPDGFDVHDPVFFWNNPVRAAQDGIAMIAEASGGFAVVDTDNFTAGIDRIIDDLDHYYLLGFYPSEPRGDGYRPIDVTVAGHPEWTARFRKGYRAEGAPKPPKNSNPRAAMMAGALPVTALPMRLHAVPLPAAGGGTPRVAVALEVDAPRSAMEEPDGRLRDVIAYEVVAVDQNKGKV
ncbi:MAG TPA: VWA domain-containing protein, partial [Vicinamibacterales bacterium]